MEKVSCILLVEDSEVDAYLVSRALEEERQVRLIRVQNVSEAMRYLEGRGEFANRGRFPVPIMILLDWTTAVGAAKANCCAVTKG